MGSKIRIGESVASIVPPPLLEHIQKFGHRSFISLSEEGDQLLILQKHKLSLRLEEEEFAENHIVWECKFFFENSCLLCISE